VADGHDYYYRGTPDEGEAIAAACELIGRTGARALEIGFLHDDVPIEDAAWWAHAQYRGGRVTVEGKRSPGHALDALLVRLLDGATCRWCGRPVTNRAGGNASKRCRYRREGATYVRGCTATHPEPTVPAEPWQTGAHDA
jgi:hypothetical protein